MTNKDVILIELSKDTKRLAGVLYEGICQSQVKCSNCLLNNIKGCGCKDRIEEWLESEAQEDE